MTDIIAAFTCHNRREKTEKAIRSIVSGNPECCFRFIVTDDGSSDGTAEQLNSMKPEFDITLITGNGNLYYSGGMRLALDNALSGQWGDYLLLMNDDVKFYPACIEKMISQSERQGQTVVVGATQDADGKLSYSAIKYTSGFHYRKLSVSESGMDADSFNANCVLIPYGIFQKAGNMDAHYVHSLADFDYGLTLHRMGVQIRVSESYVGECSGNSRKGTWTDPSLPRKIRIQKKEDVKGAPAKQWFYFLKKNFGIWQALKGSTTPYVRIMLGK